MYTCELITIGSELLNGSVLNTNAQFLARRIHELDIEVKRQVACPDQESEILKALTSAYRNADLIIVTGGLGPTPDDITRQTIAKFFGCGLKFDPRQYRHIVRYFRTLGRPTPFITRQEAYLPEVAKPLLNRFGIALGFSVFRDGKLWVVLPGVPRELMKMYDTKVCQLIKEKLSRRSKIYSHEVHLASLYEPQVMKRLGTSFFKGRIFDFGIYPDIGEVTIRVKAKDKHLIATLKKELARKLKDFIFSKREGESLSKVIGQSLLRKKMTLSIAESCTGGFLSKQITDPPGASKYFKGGIVAYSNDLKASELGISRALLKKKGAVSREVVCAMAEAARTKYCASIGIGITGIAGPSGGTPTKPVGLIFLAVSDRKRTKVFPLRFLGDRNKVRMQATQKALFLLWQWLGKK
ncbi:MAG: competence/damage-inducible protein A [Candidatus Omnitrophica bacterium]|nr:competence/damage-inducible protein A [Candidatus Omnitrophota bacterium]